MKKCVNCGEITRSECVYCPKCGRDEFEYIEEVACPRCGVPNPKGAKYCGECGATINTDLQDELIPFSPAMSVAPGLALSNVDSTAMDLSYSEEAVECPSCHTLVALSAIHCPHCGADVAHLSNQRLVHRKICNICNTPNVMEAQYCSRCFASLNDAPVEDFVLVHEVNQAGSINYTQAVLKNDNSQYLMCNNCGAVNDMSEDFCVKCGLKLRVEKQYKYCPKCGAENDGDSQFCTSCQSSLDYTPTNKKQFSWNCPSCGHVNNGNNMFCAHCGAPRQNK